MGIVLVMPSSPSGSFFFVCSFVRWLKQNHFLQMQKLKPVEEIQPEYFLKKKETISWNFFICSPGDIFRAVTSCPLPSHTRMEFCDSSSGTSEAVGRIRSSTLCLFDSFGLTSGPWSLTIPASHQREADGKGPRSSPCSYCRRSSLDADELLLQTAILSIVKTLALKLWLFSYLWAFGLVCVCHR